MCGCLFSYGKTKNRFMDFSMAASADVAANDEVQLVPCELLQQSNGIENT